MTKLTKKTIKEGQKCVLTIKTQLFSDYKSINLPWSDDRTRMTEKLPELLAIPNIAYKEYDTKNINTPGEKYYKHFLDPDGLDPKRIVKNSYSNIYFSDDIIRVMVSFLNKTKEGDIVYRYISPNVLKEMKKDAKMSKYISGTGEMKPLITLDKNTEVEIYTLSDIIKGKHTTYWDNVTLKVISGPHKGIFLYADMNSITGRLDTAHFKDLSAKENAKPKYKIFYKGKPYRAPSYDGGKGASKIYADLGKIKSSLMVRFGYHEKIYQLSQHYKDLSPEVSNSTPEWIGGYGGAPEFTRKDAAKHIQVFEWLNRKKGKEADFNVLEYYDSLMDFVKVTAQYGSAVRNQYKKFKDTNEFSTIVCFMHEDYRLPEKDAQGNYNYIYYEELKESQIIKDAMKLSKVKGTKKSTKYGKTAICFKNESDAMKLLRHLEKDSYFVLDMNGNQLIEQSEQFVQNVARMKKLERILMIEFEDDFDLEKEKIN